MTDKNVVRWAELRLVFDPPPRRLDIDHLRGAIAVRTDDGAVFHHHDGDRLVYRYPLVHYRFHRGQAYLFAYNDAIPKVLELDLLSRPLRLGKGEHLLLEADMRLHAGRLRISDELRTYEFVTPYLPLNVPNYRKYRQLDPSGRKRQLDRLVRAHLLGMAKGLDIWIKGRVYATQRLRQTRLVEFKGVQLTAFEGTIETNLELPAGVAIGQKVGFGFGWLIPSSNHARPSQQDCRNE